jgi:hypothetical protein
MTLSLNFRSDLIPEGRSAINRLGRTLGGFLLLSSPCSRFAPDCILMGIVRSANAPRSPPIRPFSRRRNRATRSSCEICTPGWKGLRNWPRSRANVGRGQSRLPQGRRGTECDPGCRSLPGLPAEILPTQPHRAGLRQVQNPAPKGASANYEGSPTPAAKFRPPHAPHTSRKQERVEPKAGYLGGFLNGSDARTRI